MAYARVLRDGKWFLLSGPTDTKGTLDPNQNERYGSNPEDAGGYGSDPAKQLTETPLSTSPEAKAAQAGALTRRNLGLENTTNAQSQGQDIREKMASDQAALAFKTQAADAQAQDALANLPAFNPNPPEPTTIRQDLANTFNPSAQEGANRRLEAFGTTSKTPAIIAGIATGAAVGATGALLSSTLAANAAASPFGGAAVTYLDGATGTYVTQAPALTTATLFSSARTLLAKALTGKNLLVGGAVQAVLGAEIKDSFTDLNNAMSAADGSVGLVGSGTMSYAEAQNNVAYLEQAIVNMERALKYDFSYHRITGHNKERGAIIRARQKLDILKNQSLPNAYKKAYIAGVAS